MAKKKNGNSKIPNAKTEDLVKNTLSSDGQLHTSNHGARINDDQNTLKAGERGPSLLEDFHFREKMTHFDHERIPERIVHARGSGAHGYFELTKSLSEYTRAAFLQEEGTQTPVFVRFSTVAGFRGSSDLARDVRGFAVKFYTEEGNFDLVGNNIPVFFIQDALKFPDLIHAVKPEPDSEMPQAASAHDTFWDFVSLMPESMHMIMWAMSDRALPRSYRMMEGFGVHTFRLVNAENESFFVKFHWKPLLGVHAVTWDEAQLISGKDPDFHRRDLWEAIEEGHFPEWEFGVQIIPEKDEHLYDFDLLDPTKLVPEELVPVEIVGKLVLNRNPDNFFAETEQVAFHPGHLVPGIDFSNDPLLQGRLFSYTDTQLSRLGGPNFQEIPINRPLMPVHNNQRDGHMRQTINSGKSSYHPNTTGGGCPFQAKMAQGGFVSHQEKIDAHKVRARSRSFFDHFSQAALFVHSQSEVEKIHLIKALCFELSKVKDEAIPKRVLILLSQVDKNLAEAVAQGLGLEVPPLSGILNHSIPADGKPEDFQPQMPKSSNPEISQALSMANTVKNSIKSRRIAFLVSEGVDEVSLNTMREILEDAKAMVTIISTRPGNIAADTGKEIRVEENLFSTASVFFDALFVPNGRESSDSLQQDEEVLNFIREMYKHSKVLAADRSGTDLLHAAIPKISVQGETRRDNLANGILINRTPKEFIQAVAQHRFWNREKNRAREI